MVLPTNLVVGSPGDATNANVVHGHINNMVSAVFNVKDYGAIGDGTTNDTAAVSSALTAAIAAKGELYLPGGTYLLTTSLTISANSVTIRGAGKDATILLYNGSTSAITSGAGTTNYTRWRFSDFTIDSRNASSGTIGLDLNNIGRSVFQNVRFRCTVTAGGGIGVKFTGGDVSQARSTYYNTFIDCEFAASDKAITTAGYANIQKFYGGLTEGAGISVFVEEGSTTNNVDGWVFSGMSFGGSGSDMIVLGKASGSSTSVTNFQFNGCRYEAATPIAITLHPNCIRPTFIGGGNSAEVTITDNAVQTTQLIPSYTGIAFKFAGTRLETSSDGISGGFIGYPLGTSDATLIASRSYWWKVSVAKRFTFDQAVIRVVTQSGNIDVGLYASSAGAVGNKIVSSGSVACPAPSKGIISLASTTIDPGVYYMALALDNATASLTVNARASEWLGMVVKSSTFPLPSNGSGVTASTSSLPVMTLEKS